jgi:hypothetical protein
VGSEMCIRVWRDAAAWVAGWRRAVRATVAWARDERGAEQ